MPQAGAAIRQLLDDPKTRVTMLRQLQHFGVPSDDDLDLSDAPFWNEWVERRNHLVTLPDMAAAIDAVGRITTFSIAD
jgi:hypothetical protein